MDTEFRPLTADDVGQLLDVRSVAYSPISDRDAAADALEWRLPHSLGAFYGGRLRSVTFMYPLKMNLGGVVVPMGGLSGVATAPEARRRGLVAKALRRWYADLRDRGIGWSAEHPFEPTFYAKLGYQTVQNGHLVVTTPVELRSSAGARLGEPLDAEPVGAESADRLHAIYAAYASRFSFSLTRDDGVKDHWGMTFRRPWEKVAQFGYLMEDAYVVLTTENPTDEPWQTTLKVRDLAYSSPAGRERLFAFLASFEGQVDKVRLHLPPGDPIALDRAAFGTDKAPELQVRLVDLQAGLGSLSWPEPVRLVLRVHDPDCEWNDGLFEVELDGGATVRRVDGLEPDASLDVRALAALVTCAVPAESLVADGLAQGSSAKLKPLARAVAGHPVFKPHNDHF